MIDRAKVVSVDFKSENNNSVKKVMKKYMPNNVVA